MAGKAKKPDYQVENLAAMPSWKFRRRAVFGSLIFAAVIISYITWRLEDNGLSQTIVLGAFGLMGAIIAAYIGGATYQDVKIWNAAPIVKKDSEEQVD